jgi:osmoprotectant transport system substrate-binding protein
MRTSAAPHRRSALATLGVSFLLAAACTGGGPAAPATAMGDDAITVGSFNFPESRLLGELYAQALERAGFRVVRSFAIGPRELLMPALQRGLLEVVPEYEGSALAFLGGHPTADPAETAGALRVALAGRGLTALTPAPAEDRNTFVMTADTADRLGVRRLSDLRTDAGSLRFGGPSECQERPLCLGGLREVYGLRFASFTLLDAGGPVTLQALREDFVDVALLFSTDPALGGGEFVQLVDDRMLEPADRVIPVINDEVASRFGPEATETLDAVSRTVTTAGLRQMNAQVAGGIAIAEVASSWLTDHLASG